MVQKIIDFIKDRMIITNIDFEIAEKAVDISIKNNLHTVDYSI